MKLPYSRAECRWHAPYIAAICPECFRLAEEQQERQVHKARQEAHAFYLQRLAPGRTDKVAGSAQDREMTRVSGRDAKGEAHAPA